MHSPTLGDMRLRIDDGMVLQYTFWQHNAVNKPGKEQCLCRVEDSYFFLIGRRSVTVVLGFDFTFAGVTNRPVPASRRIVTDFAILLSFLLLV